MTTRTASERLKADLVLTWHPITADQVDPVEVPLNEHIAWYPEELGEFRLSTREAPPTADTASTMLGAADPVEHQPDAGMTNCWTVVGTVEVHAYNGSASGELFGPRVVVGRPDSPVLVFTARQARALAEVLPAAASKCDEFEERSHG
jgi:hypothetical protein